MGKTGDTAAIQRDVNMQKKICWWDPHEVKQRQLQSLGSGME